MRGAGDHECLRIGEPDVLAGEDHDPPSDEHRILAGVDHAHQPVQRRVWVRPAHALDEGGDRVVVLVPGAVVEERSALEGLADLLEADGAHAVRPCGSRVSSELERVQRDACVSVAHRDECVLGVVRQRNLAAEPALVRERTTHDHANFVLGERLERDDARARQQRGVHLERRVLRRRAEEDNVAVFDVRQDDVLLRFVETMDLVDEQNGPLIRQLAQLPRLVDQLAELLDPG